METILDRFLRYIAIDTQSDPNSETFPSTAKQYDLLHLLVAELKAMGIAQVQLDEHGYVMAKIPSNTDHKTAAIGFLAHVDTAPDMSGANVLPQMVKSYDGGKICLNQKENIVLDPEAFPELLQYVGQDLVTTDGTTLLGADDKAGLAVIMHLAETLQQNPQLKHGDICIGFTPDEEIGRGVDFFNVEAFGAEYAYTVDGGQLGELEYENFNAAGAAIEIQGLNIHPGYAKGKMLNALHIAQELNAMLPGQQRPEHTSGYEGFFHLIQLNGSVEHASMQYIIRDHDRSLFETKKQWMQSCVNLLNQRYGAQCIELNIKDQYYNMREMVEPHPYIIERAYKAMEKAGVTPIVKPIRGGTDGARLSFMNLPCPNIFGGAHNFHGKYEFLPVQSMEKSFETVLNIVLDH